MLNIFKKTKTVSDEPLDLKQEEQRLIQELEDVRERMKSEVIKNRNIDDIETAFKDAGYEFSLSPHPALWDTNYTLLTIENIKDGNIIARGHHKPDELNEVLNYLESHLDTVVLLLKPRDCFKLDGIYINSDSITVNYEIDYNSSRNSWYGTCRVSLADNKVVITINLEHYVPVDDEVTFQNGVVRGMYTDAGHAPIIAYKIYRDDVETDNINEVMDDMYKALCETIDENDE